MTNKHIHEHICCLFFFSDRETVYMVLKQCQGRPILPQVEFMPSKGRDCESGIRSRLCIVQYLFPTWTWRWLYSSVPQSSCLKTGNVNSCREWSSEWMCALNTSTAMLTPQHPSPIGVTKPPPYEAQRVGGKASLNPAANVDSVCRNVHHSFHPPEVYSLKTVVPAETVPTEMR